MPLPRSVSTSDLALALGCNERTIGKLVDRGILRREARGSFDFLDALRAYQAHREATIRAECGQGAYGKARAEWTLEKARMARLRREELEGKLIPTSEVLATNTALFALVRSRVLGMAAKVAPRAAMKPVADVHSVIYDEAVDCLTQLSETQVIPARSAARKNG